MLVKIRFKFLEVSSSITIVRVTYYANDGSGDRHHLRSQVMFRVMASGFMTYEGAWVVPGGIAER